MSGRRDGSPGDLSANANVIAMLEARKASVWKNRYDITADGRRLATWDGSLWKAGGTFEPDERRYDVGGNTWGTFVLAVVPTIWDWSAVLAGTTVASA
ncbi:MAG: hypothetical protein QOE61_949 [Micromonosporaceae bacterium]|nr:hypothetical protein [Micromonosporaceae bacterium]